MSSDEPTERLTLMITRDLWNAIDKQARIDGRHITSMARLLLERGLLTTWRPIPPPPKPKPKPKRRNRPTHYDD